MEEIPKKLDCAVLPSPLSWGKINHIQCPRLLPCPSSAITLAKTCCCASTNRCRLQGSSICLPHSTIVPEIAGYSSSLISEYVNQAFRAAMCLHPKGVH